MNTRKGTSEVLTTENQDGSLLMQYEDYGVGVFGEKNKNS